MKLKYYLRGLAVGILVTTLILTIANRNNKPMTDTQIRQRALELGMVESDSLKLSDVAEPGGKSGTVESSSSEESSTVESSSPEEGSASESSPSEESSTSGSSSPEESGTVESSPSKEQPSSSESNASKESNVPESSESTATDEEDTKPTETQESYVLTIKSGDSSYTVSRELAAAGLVDDAAAFDTYLCDNGYSRKIRTGTYEIAPGMTYKEIAEMIA